MSTALQQFIEPVKPPVDEVKPASQAITLRLALGAALPLHEAAIELGSLRRADLKILEAFSVRFVEEDGRVRAEAPEIGEFGFGPTNSDALIDLQHAIAELYLTLEEDRDRLGSDLRETWLTLAKKIRRRA